MIIFANDLSELHIIHCDVCIVGSGPAGLTCALEIERCSKKKIRICVLESSAASPEILRGNGIDSACDSDVQHFYQGDVQGWLRHNDAEYLTKSRLRYYGGTSNVWSGWCWPLEDRDLSPIGPELGASWPFGLAELKPFYERSLAYLGLGPFEFDDITYWLDRLSGPRLSDFTLNNYPFRSRLLQINPCNFRVTYDSALLTSDQISLVRNANVVHIGSADKCQIDQILIRSVENGKPGRVIKVVADRYILAAGTLETTRLLLHAGFGSTHVQLGRNFIEHFYLWNGGTFDILSSAPPDVLAFYFSATPHSVSRNLSIVPALVAKDAFLEEHNIGGFRVLLGGRQGVPGTINLSWEQKPNGASRVLLSDRAPLDLFGHKRIEVCPNLDHSDLETPIVVLPAVCEMLEQLKIATNFNLPDLSVDPFSWRSPFNIVAGNHPMGTTKMSLSPEEGVVDSNSQLHNVSNLFILGSSTFPSGGYANPTMTIVALAVRLAHWISYQ